jgi:hypothetical protein
MKLLIAFLMAMGLLTCGDEKKSRPDECSLEATVVDYTGTDGCGLMFELKDGTRLVPQRLVYITAPSREADPIYYYDMKVGEKAFIGYRDAGTADACMMGQLVFITCIESGKED